MKKIFNLLLVIGLFAVLPITTFAEPFNDNNGTTAIIKEDTKTIIFTDYKAADKLLELKEEEDLWTIEVHGENEFSGMEFVNVKMTGDGTMKFSGEDLLSGKSLTIDGAKLMVASSGDDGISDVDNFVINSGDVSFDFDEDLGDHGLFCNALTVNGGNVLFDYSFFNSHENAFAYVQNGGKVVVKNSTFGFGSLDSMTEKNSFTLNDGTFEIENGEVGTYQFNVNGGLFKGTKANIGSKKFMIGEKMELKNAYLFHFVYESMDIYMISDVDGSPNEEYLNFTIEPKVVPVADPPVENPNTGMFLGIGAIVIGGIALTSMSVKKKMYRI